MADKTAGGALARSSSGVAARSGRHHRTGAKEQLNTLPELVEKRQRRGDLGSIDAESPSSLSQQLAQVAD